MRAVRMQVGWPSFLPTSEQQIFARNVHNLKQKQLKVMLSGGQLPLRDGVEQVCAMGSAGVKMP